MIGLGADRARARRARTVVRRARRGRREDRRASRPKAEARIDGADLVVDRAAHRRGPDGGGRAASSTWSWPGAQRSGDRRPPWSGWRSRPSSTIQVGAETPTAFGGLVQGRRADDVPRRPVHLDRRDDDRVRARLPAAAQPADRRVRDRPGLRDDRRDAASPASADLLLLFLGLELMVLPGYLLAGYHKTDAYSTEGAIKYFLLGSFSSAIFLFGLAFVWGLTGTTLIDSDDPSGRASPRCSAAIVAGRRAAVGGPGDRPRVPDDGRRVQDRRGPVPLLDAGRVPGLADADHRLPVGRAEGRRLRADPAAVRRGARAAGRMVAAGDDRPRRPDDDARQPRRADPGQRQADAGVQLDRPHRATCSSAWPPTPAARCSGSQGLLFYGAAYTFMNLGAFAVVAALQKRAGVTSVADTFAGLGRREPLLAS